MLELFEILPMQSLRRRCLEKVEEEIRIKIY